MNNENKHTVLFDLTVKYLSGEANGLETTSLEELVKNSAEYKKLFIQYKRAWQLSASKGQHFNKQQAWSTIEKTIGSKTTETPVVKIHQQNSNKALFYKIAAGVIVFLTVGFMSYFYFYQNKTTELLASNQILIETLLDGTEVSLNQQSSLSWDRSFNKKERRVSLQGDAHFDVAKNPDKPFIIETGEVSIRVLGTAFYVNARSNKNKIEVNVSRGKVAVETSGQNKIILEAGEVAIFDKREKLLVKHQNKDKNVMSWKTKIMVFENTPLGEVVRIINRTYDVDLQLANPKTSQCQLTATFEKLPLEDVLSVISETLSLDWNKKGNIYLLSGENCD